MFKVDSLSLIKFVKKLTLEKMIKEVTFSVNQDSITCLTCDELRQLIIDGSLKIKNEENSFLFTIPNVKEFYDKVSKLDGELQIDILDNVLSLKSSDKELKLGLINPNLYHGILSVFKKDIRENELSISIRDQNIVYSDSLNTTGKELRGYLELAKIVEANAYLLTQVDGKLQLLSESKLKKDSVKLDLKLKNVFSKDKTYWIYNFVKYILSNNPDSIQVFIQDISEPMVIASKDESTEILYVIAPK